MRVVSITNAQAAENLMNRYVAVAMRYPENVQHVALAAHWATVAASLRALTKNEEGGE